MPVPTQATASERVVLLLRPKEKSELQRLARKEKVSAAELIRRSLAMYAEFDAMAKSGKLAKAEAALDRTLASIQSASRTIDATLKSIDQRRRDPAAIAAQKQLDEFVRQASPATRRKPSRHRVAA